ncbi:MAG: hypothetical protein FWG21_03045, partial [Oscillospiraceae bacterium]|nr:hypothetical protein [Oscillospiraceae bacterium]
MKIPITQTEILAIPGSENRAFYNFVTDDSIRFTPIQKTAALCVRVYFSMINVGRTFKIINEDFDNVEELIEAVHLIGLSDLAESLSDPSLVELSEDEYENNLETIYTAIEEYRQDHFDDFFEIVEENYTLRPPKDGVWVALFIVVVVLIFGIIAALTNPNPDDRRLFLLIINAELVFTGLVLLIYALRWKIVVVGSNISFNFLFRKNIKLTFSDISAL